MRQIRRNVFETNSSSTHSISINGGDVRKIDYPLHVAFGEFGWGYEVLDTPQEKLAYVLTMIVSKNSDSYSDHNNKDEVLERLINSDAFTKVNNVVEQYTGRPINLDVEIQDSYYSFGYIDHQSNDTLDDILYSEEELANLLFNSAVSIIIDNDNH